MTNVSTNVTRMLSAILFIGLIGGLGGCATPEPGSPVAVALEQAEKEEDKADATEQTVDELPDWFLNMPPDAHSIFARGTATSPDLQLAMDKAVLSAKRSLADSIKSRISSSMDVFVTEVGQGADIDLITEVERVTKNLFTEVNVVGYSQVEAKVIAQGTNYRAYILLQYPHGDANRILIDQVKNSQVLEAKLRKSKAFKELEEEIEAARDN